MSAIELYFLGHDRVDGLTQAAFDLCREGIVSEEVLPKITSALDVWARDAAHGASHSADVYYAMDYLRRKEGGEYANIPDSHLAAAAVLHDLMQTVPILNPRTGEALKVNQRKEHARAMAIVLERFGPRIGIEAEACYEIGEAIRHHDDAYEASEQLLSPLGKLLSDADKIAGMNIELDAEAMMRFTVKRNLGRVGARDGWHFLRDLTTEEREGWKYGDRWLKDKLSAVLHDMAGIKYHTRTAQQLAERRLQAFRERGAEEYGLVYGSMAAAVEFWMHNTACIKASLVGKGQEEVFMPGFSPAELIDSAFGMALPLPPEYLRDDLVPHGWMVQLDFGGITITIDPSVARFCFTKAGELDIEGGRERFCEAIHQVVGEYVHDCAY